jgi:hypothetical protein
MSRSLEEHIRERIASGSRSELEELKRRAVAMLERVQTARKYRLRSKVEEIEADVAIETLAQVDVALGRRNKWLLGGRRLLLRMRYLR